MVARIAGSMALSVTVLIVDIVGSFGEWVSTSTPLSVIAIRSSILTPPRSSYRLLHRSEINMLIITVVPLVEAALAYFLIPRCPGQTPQAPL